MKLRFTLPGISLLLSILSCQNNQSENDPVVALSDSTSVTGMSGDSVKLVKTASIQFKVKDVEQSARAISGIARELGGMIFHQNVASTEGERREVKVSPDSLMVITAYRPQADIMARIPSPNLEGFMYSMIDLGYYTTNSRMDIDDRSLTYLENALKQQNRTLSLARPNPVKAKGVSTMQTIAVKDEMIEQAINNRAIDADVKYSTVNLSLIQNPLVRKEVIANYYIADYSLPFGKRLSDSLGAGWEYFINFFLLVCQFWVFLLAGIVLWVSYRYWQQKPQPQIK